tara:strand:- start:51 stop:335 length:285 start_codon:yes stop_codon:yes gene_type:complete
MSNKDNLYKFYNNIEYCKILKILDDNILIIGILINNTPYRVKVSIYYTKKYIFNKEKIIKLILNKVVKIKVINYNNNKIYVSLYLNKINIIKYN